MKILFDIEHPAHVHVYKHTIRSMQEKGHEVLIIAKNKEITTNLLDRLGFEYELVSRWYPGMAQKIYGVLDKDIKLLAIARRFKPDLMTALLSPHIAHVGKILGTPTVTLTDTEDAKLGNMLTFPFTDAICTPDCFLKDLGKKHVRFAGYKELAYLHPNHFTPDPSVLDPLGLSVDDRFIILRFISWSASHDVGLSGIDMSSAKEFISRLEKYGRVLITSEKKLSAEIEPYRVALPTEQMHSLMYYSQLYIGEGGTMAAESAILGTPAVHIESNSKGVATGTYSGNFLELRDKYGLLYFYPRQDQALEKAITILENPRSKAEWKKKKEKLLSEKVDVASWMTDFLVRYPESFETYKKANI